MVRSGTRGQALVCTSTASSTATVAPVEMQIMCAPRCALHGTVVHDNLKDNFNFFSLCEPINRDP